jgi:repressor LexA
LPEYSNKVSTGVVARQRIDYLTDLQERIRVYIHAAITERGEAPTLAEIGSAVGLGSRSAVHYQLTQMRLKGALTWEPHQARGIRLT